MSEKKLTVPKFSSFKPKPAQDTPLSNPPPSDAEGIARKRSSRDRDAYRDDGDDDRTHRRHHHHHHHHRSRRRGESPRTSRRHSRDRARRSRSPPREPSGPASASSHRRPASLPSTTPPVSEPGLFVIDTVGDTQFARYGQHDPACAVPFRRVGGSHVLGTNGRLVVHRDGASGSRTEGGVSLRSPGDFAGGGGGGRSELSKSGRSVVPAAPRRIKARPPEDLGSDDGDFIAFETSKKRKRADDDSSEDEGKPIAELLDRDLEIESDSSAAEDEPPDSSPLWQTSVNLCGRVRECPDDMAAWLALVAHQDALMDAGEGPHRDGASSESREEAWAAAHSFAEIKLSMLESALPHAVSASDRDEVLRGIMREGARAWPPDSARDKMLRLIEANRESHPVWMAYIDHEMQNPADFRVDRIKQLFLERLSYLRGRIRAAQAAAASEPLYGQCIYVFLRATRFLDEAGFGELAVAAWQGLLELNLFRPSDLQNEDDTILASFRDFWEDERPRIGEDGAQGWRHYHCQAGPPDDQLPEPSRHLAGEKPNRRGSGDPVRDWYEAERRAALAARMPARILDASAADDDSNDDDDPFRVVMFSDLQGLVFAIRPPPSAGLTELLVDSFLVFCRAPPAWGSSPLIQAAVRDQFLSCSLRDLEREATTMLLPPRSDAIGDPTDSSSWRNQPAFLQDGMRVAISAQVLFPGKNWFRYIVPPRHLYPTGDGPVQPGWILNTVRQLTRLAKIEALAPYCLGWEWAVDRTDARRAARALLRQYPDNLQLYSCYALAEFFAGERNKTEKVLRAATVLALAQPSGADRAMVLWETWAWTFFLEVGPGDYRYDGATRAVSRLCAAVNPELRTNPDTEASQLQVLKTKQAFMSRRVALLTGDGEHYDLAVCYAGCLGLLEYLTAASGEGTEPMSGSQGCISVAIDSIRDFSDLMVASGLGSDPSHERLLQLAARILYVHASRGPFRRAFVRDHLAHFTSHFPHNAIFLSLFSWADPGLPAARDPLRDLLRDVVLTRTRDCVPSRAQAIRHELAGNANRARAAFESALNSDACGASAALWRCYLRFCCSRGRQPSRRRGGKGTTPNKDRSDARSVFYRAVARCPWSRDLIMEAAALPPECGMDEGELRSVMGGWIGRGLRVHGGELISTSEGQGTAGKRPAARG